MVEKMNGTWKMVSAEGFDEYMKALGVNSVVRKMIKLAKPKAVIEVRDGNFTYKSVSSVRTMETKCRLGEEFVENLPDGSKAKSMMEESNGVLIHTQKWDNKETTIIRYVDDSDRLIMDFDFEGVKSRRVFQRKK